MEITIVAGLFAKRDMYVNAAHEEVLSSLSSLEFTVAAVFYFLTLSSFSLTKAPQPV